MGGVFSVSLAGLQHSVRSVETAARRIAGFGDDSGPIEQPAGSDHEDGGGGSTSDLELAAALVEMKQQASVYEANATMIRVADRMTGTLLDITR